MSRITVMSFLPIVERELRVAARKRSLYRVRVLVAGSTVFVGALLLGIGYFSGGTRMGGQVFTVLLRLAFVYCLLEGLRAADAVSEEKREGTLGLLFLTDLRGYDVVLGKLIAVAVRSFHGVLAFVPMLGIALILGGVTVGEFWRSALALVITLFVALAAALCVSTLSRQAHRAMGFSIALLLVLAVLPAVLESPAGRSLPKALGWVMARASPTSMIGAAPDLTYRFSPEHFWTGTAVNLGLACLVLLVASLAVPRTWKEGEGRPALFPTLGAVWQRWQRGNPERRTSRRSRLLDRNPFHWLASRHPRDPLNFGAGFGALCGVGLVAGVVGDMSAAWISGMLLSLALKAWICWRAVQVFAEARRHGALEWFLTTPRSTEEMIRGPMIALRELFCWPAIFVMILLVVPSHALFGANPVDALWSAGLASYGVVTLLTGAFASGWVGLWFGLSQRKMVPAFLITLLVSIVGPALAFCVPNVIIHVALIWWFRSQLHRKLRVLGSGEFQQTAHFEPRPARLPNQQTPPIIPQT